MSEVLRSAPAAPARVDTDRPSAARMYDWFLGGTQNWAVDREFARKVERVWPHIRVVAKQNRQFMNRVVRHALDAGIRQFVDLGSGEPTIGNVHEVVRRHLPKGERARVAYVDYEPISVVHLTAMLDQDRARDWATVAQHDLRDVPGVLADRDIRKLIDFSKPVCLLMIAVLHFLGDDDLPGAVVDAYRDELAPGSWLGLSHIASDEAEPAEKVQIERFSEAYQRTTNPLWVRDREEIEGWFDGWQLMRPGFVHLPDWRPERRVTEEEAAGRPFAWCGVGEKP